MSEWNKINTSPLQYDSQEENPQTCLISKGLDTNHSGIYIFFKSTWNGPKHAIQILQRPNKLLVAQLYVIFMDDYNGYISSCPLEQHNLTLFL